MVENPYIGRIVTLLTPVFAGVSGYVAQLAAQHLPGAPALDETELTAIFIAGALAVVPVVREWLKNRGAYEDRQELIAADSGGPASSALGASDRTR